MGLENLILTLALPRAASPCLSVPMGRGSVEKKNPPKTRGKAFDVVRKDFQRQMTQERKQEPGFWATSCELAGDSLRS